VLCREPGSRSLAAAFDLAHGEFWVGCIFAPGSPSFPQERAWAIPRICKDWQVLSGAGLACARSLTHFPRLHMPRHYQHHITHDSYRRPCLRQNLLRRRQLAGFPLPASSTAKRVLVLNLSIQTCFSLSRFGRLCYFHLVIAGPLVASWLYCQRNPSGDESRIRTAFSGQL
jgi:hypothetical protein